MFDDDAETKRNPVYAWLVRADQRMRILSLMLVDMRILSGQNIVHSIPWIIFQNKLIPYKHEGTFNFLPRPVKL